MFYYDIIRRVRKAKKFILAKIKLIWLISKDVKSNFKALSCNEISRVRIIEFSVLKKTKRRVDKSRERSSYKGLTEDALVHGAEEGRDKLRKAAGRSKYLEIRRYPNEGTQHE